MSESIPIYSPQILRETAEGISRVDIRDEMLANRELELTCGVDAVSCAGIIRGLLYLQRQDADALHQQSRRRGAVGPGAL